MRTLVLLGIAAIVVVWTDPAHAGHDSPPGGQRVVVERHVAYADPAGHDERVYINDDDRQLTEAEYRERWSGRWDGQWTPDGSQWRGVYEGSYTPHRTHAGYRDDDYRGADYDHDYDYDYDYDGREPVRIDRHAMERLCGRRNTAGGAIVGGLIGGIAGNRIAGRGDRTERTIIGGVVGAGVGAAIGSAEDRRRCERWWARDGAYRHAPRRYRYAPQYYAPQYYAYAYPAYYYPAPAVTTVIIEGGGQVTTRTVTHEYETLSAPTKRVRRVYSAPAKRTPVKTKRVYRK